jgi:ribosome-associated protein
LEQLSVLATRKRKRGARITKNSKFFKTVIQAIQEKKGDKIVSLDLRKIQEAAADFFIICEASSHTQVKAISDFVEIKVKKSCEEIPYKQEGKKALQWVLIDYINIVVHVMLPESRDFYRLEELWSDALRQDHAE